MHIDRFRQAATEAANRAEVTALLIRYGYRVYRPEADIEGEDLVVRAPQGVRMPAHHLCGVQLKGRPMVDGKRYGGRDLWMLFPSASYDPASGRTWFLLPHDGFFEWVKNRHGASPKWGEVWHYPSISKDLAAYLSEWRLEPARDTSHAERFVYSGGGKVYREDGTVLDLSDE